MKKLRSLFRKEYFYSLFITFFLLLTTLLFFAIRGFLNPTEYLNTDPYFDLYFEPFFPLNLAIDVHGVILGFVFIVIPFVVPFFVISLISDNKFIKRVTAFAGFGELLYILSLYTGLQIKSLSIYFDERMAIFAVFLLILVFSLIPLFLLDEGRKKSRKSMIFVANMGASFVSIILLFVLLVPLNIYLNNTMYKKIRKHSS